MALCEFGALSQRPACRVWSSGCAVGAHILGTRGVFILTFQSRNIAGRSKETNARKLAALQKTVCALPYGLYSKWASVNLR